MTMILDSHTTERPAPPGRHAAVRSIFTLPTARIAPERRVALIGNYTPRKCGIATFTADIHDKLAEFHPEIAVDIYALDDPRQPQAYGGIAGTVVWDDPESYAAAARRINDSGVDPCGFSTNMASSAGPTARWCSISSTAWPRR